MKTELANQNERAHLSTQLCGAILNQSTDHRRKMRVNSTNDTKTKTTKRMPFKFYISVISHYYSNVTYGEFISWQCEIQGLLGVESVLRRVAEYWRRFTNAHERFRMELHKNIWLSISSLLEDWFVGACCLACCCFEILPPTITRNIKFPEVRHETERHYVWN